VCVCVCIHKPIHTLKMHKFGVDRSPAWGLVSGEQSNIRVLPLLEISSLTLPCANAHAVIKVI